MIEKKFTEDHEWVSIDGNIATVGISNHAQESLGDIVFIELPVIGKTVKAKELWNDIGYAAWASADPGLQFDTTINEWHTCPESGRITAGFSPPQRPPAPNPGAARSPRRRPPPSGRASPSPSPSPSP